MPARLPGRSLRRHRLRDRARGATAPRRSIIRAHALEDHGGIGEPGTAASRIVTPFLSDGFAAAERERIRTAWLPVAETWVADHEGAVAGFISLIGHEVGGLFVHPDHQGRGIGRGLMDHAIRLRGSLFLDVVRPAREG